MRSTPTCSLKPDKLAIRSSISIFLTLFTSLGSFHSFFFLPFFVFFFFSIWCFWQGSGCFLCVFGEGIGEEAYWNSISWALVPIRMQSFKGRVCKTMPLFLGNTKNPFFKIAFLGFNLFWFTIFSGFWIMGFVYFF